MYSNHFSSFNATLHIRLTNHTYFPCYFLQIPWIGLIALGQNFSLIPKKTSNLKRWLVIADTCFQSYIKYEHYALCSSFNLKRATAEGCCWPLLSTLCIASMTFCDFSCDALLLLAMVWLLVLAAGTSWLCFPSYVVITALGSVETLSICFLTLQPGLVHL